MNLTLRNPAPRRSAFTLIELLVVIAIIAILASLLLAGVMMMLGKGDDVKNRNDILQLNTAVERFKTKYGFYPPDKMKLCSNRAAYDTNSGSNPNYRLDIQSLSCLSKMFPNLGVFTGIDWGNGAAAVGDILDADQTLVFFLLGPGTKGFSTNPTNPGLTGFTASTDPIRFMDSPAGRLTIVPHAAPYSSAFPSFIDAYGTQPFLYFSTFAGGRSNGYDINITSPPRFVPVTPYFQGPPASPQFYKANSFQIVSAGKDKTFGPGGPWVQANATAIAPAGRDDMTNFYDSNMGVP